MTLSLCFFRLAGSKAFEEETKAPQRKLNHVFKNRQIEFEYFDDDAVII